MYDCTYLPKDCKIIKFPHSDWQNIIIQSTFMYILTVPQCYSNGNVQLVGGASSNEGRVEVCVNGMWGTVTNSGWDSREATVVCKQLGYQNPSE